jgi:lipid-A-disaccharide synthase-like uncharacterized protein
VNWIHVIQDKGQWLVPENTAMNLRVLTEKLLASQEWLCSMQVANAKGPKKIFSCRMLIQWLSQSEQQSPILPLLWGR